MKPKLLIVELWGLGDLAIATPFLRAATEKFEVTLLAKPFAHDLQARLWPGVRVETFTAPWTAFKHKYYFWRWPVFEIGRLRRRLLETCFDIGLSARWDPRDHLLLKLFRAQDRLGFPRMHSEMFLTRPLARPEPQSHRYESWRVLAGALDLQLPPREKLFIPSAWDHKMILIHTGAAQAVRVWPLEHYKKLAARLRRGNFPVQVACDPDQREWWLQAGETEVATPHNVADLIALVDRAGAFIGNDSGPGHLAAICGVPTFTIFGPQLPEWFAPLHPASEWIEGKACPYKPCSDYCRFATPFCLRNLGEEEVFTRVGKFLAAQRPAAS
ncbi:MAG: glycosyltransferase family 9 protein [Verrucomicrobiales bacterium]|nr:glycosyltransferase family 9 protein [Verrucomicrobiales bacterium]